MYTMTEARYSDVEDVMHDMSDLSLQEMAACGVKHAWHGLKRAKVCKDKGFLKVMRDDKGPLFVFGAAEMNPGVFRTWFIGTERYFDPKNVKVAAATAKAMASIADRHPRFVFEARSASRHEQVLRWFGLLGFSFVEQKDGMLAFRYVGRKLANSGKYGKLLS